MNNELVSQSKTSELNDSTRRRGDTHHPMHTTRMFMVYHQFKSFVTKSLALFEVLIELKRMRMIQYEFIKKTEEKMSCRT